MGNVRMRAEQINYGANNVKVALDDLDPAALIALNNRMNKIDAWKATVKTEEKIGAEVTFTNALALAAVSLSAEIEAIQDLHGQSAPYVGGAGKNKLPMTVESIKAANTGGTWNGNSYTHNGVTYTIQTDNDNNITGFNIGSGATASGESYLNVKASLNDIPNDTYILNGCPSSGADDTYKLMVIKSPSPSYADKGNGITVTKDNTVTLYQARIVIANGYTIPNGGLLFKPMLRLSTETDPTFAPYSNICPISGRDSVAVDDLPNADYVPFFEGVKNGTYGFVDLGTLEWTYYTSDTNPNFQTSLSGIKPPSRWGVAANVIMANYGTTNWNDMVASASVGKKLVAITPTSKVGISDPSYTDAATFTTAMSGVYLIYELATPTTPSYTTEQWAALVNSFGATNVTIQLGQTVYGGTLNVTTGVLTVTHANIASYNGETINEPWISSLDEYTQGGTPTTGAQVVYTLAAPTTIQLTPEQLTMLKGYNRISADTGDITVEAYTGAAWGGDE